VIADTHAEEHKQTLERRLVRLNGELTRLNEEMRGLEHRRDGLHIQLRKTARALHMLNALAIRRQDYASGKRI
jgi:hypothetical protein